ncbi:hypothetical protein L596_003511 [Steinernema carpocapsae]|uniref:Uncharacterized protein n=1 Tax=Steinernema carpocapsae TaxID=34508 RepID=A0A4U8UWU4_STECR|nr:hypothetical protein L596_003511 [Steinernema carpocapsae]
MDARSNALEQTNVNIDSSKNSALVDQSHEYESSEKVKQNENSYHEKLITADAITHGTPRKGKAAIIASNTQNNHYSRKHGRHFRTYVASTQRRILNY